MKIFEKLYELHGQLEREGERVELVLGDGILSWRRANTAANRHPVLVVPGEQVLKAKHLAEGEGISDRMTILALEDFVAQNVIEISAEHGNDFYATLQQIIEEYNRRIEEAETDIALKIELK